MATIMAKRIVGRGFPPDEGAKLAKSIMSTEPVQWEDLVIDATGLPASLLISAFYNGFLQHVYEQNPSALGQARKVKWTLAFQFQTDNAAKWVAEFEPVDAQAAVKS